MRGMLGLATAGRPFLVAMGRLDMDDAMCPAHGMNRRGNGCDMVRFDGQRRLLNR